jgi:transketolase
MYYQRVDFNLYSPVLLDERSKYLRQLAIDALEGGQRGHVGSTFSLIEILRVLYDDVLFFDVDNPKSPERDRFILSKGHGCIAQYVMLADKGFISKLELKNFCHFTSHLGGHPELGHVPGVEASTGSLGHGLAIATGMAYAAKINSEKFRVYVVLGDGELNEGSVWESALAAGSHKLNNLIAIVDYNKMQSYGPLKEVWDLEPLEAKFQSFGWKFSTVDGHSISQLQKTLNSAPEQNRPHVVIANTIKGAGASIAENNPNWHHKSNLTDLEILDLRKDVNA